MRRGSTPIRPTGPYLVLIDGVDLWLAAVGRREHHLQRPRAGDEQIRGLVLVGVRVPAYHYRLRPARHQARDVAADDGLAEHGAAQDVTDGAVRRLPHLLQAELWGEAA